MHFHCSICLSNRHETISVLKLISVLFLSLKFTRFFHFHAAFRLFQRFQFFFSLSQSHVWYISGSISRLIGYYKHVWKVSALPSPCPWISPNRCTRFLDQETVVFEQLSLGTFGILSFWLRVAWGYRCGLFHLLSGCFSSNFGPFFFLTQWSTPSYFW